MLQRKALHHQQIDERSRRLAETIADRLRQRPELLAVARDNMTRWSPGVRNRAAWERLLDLPLEEMLAIYQGDSERGRDLRQDAPFAGILSPRERLEWLRQDHDANPA